MANLFINEKFDDFLKKNMKTEKKMLFEKFNSFVNELKTKIKGSTVNKEEETIKITFSNGNYIEYSVKDELPNFFHNLNGFEEMIMM